MPLPTPNLDDLRFQSDLVDEARRRIVRYCPEWTDYNLSDPGITLIELFAWMTELIVYRLNRVPEKNHIKFLELLGIQLQPASSARTELTFRLSAPFPLGPEDDTAAIVPQGTEVATQATDEEAEVIFTTDERLTITAPVLTQLRRDADFNRNYLSRLGVEDFYAFDENQPREGDTFYLGFDVTQDVSGYILQLRFECQEAEATGIRREDPPLVWECSLGEGRWAEVSLSTRRGEKDTTGGLNNPQGSLVLYLPLNMWVDRVHGRNAYWVRCRFEQRYEGHGTYRQSPRISNVTTYSLGGTVQATHAVIVRDEVVGQSTGEPGQIFHLQHAPVLSLGSGETVEVEEERDDLVVFIPWERVTDFADSSRYDRHFHLEEVSGEVHFGPCVRQPDSTMCQYGRVPEAGRRIHVSQYRHGGGVVGNVPAGKIQVLRSAIPYIDRVINLQRATGGRDQESLEEAQIRAQRELRAQQRAVTAEDFEDFARAASRAVARVKCSAPGEAGGPLPPGMVELLTVPAAFDALAADDLSALELNLDLENTVRAHLDQYRLLTTTINIREPRYLGMKVVAKIVLSEYYRPETVIARATDYLKHFIAPLNFSTDDDRLTETLGRDWQGWPFGQNLYVSEVYSLLQRVPGVKHVVDVELAQRPVVPSQESALQELPDEPEEEMDLAVEEDQAPRAKELTPVEDRMVTVPPDTLLCSLDHEVQVVEL